MRLRVIIKLVFVFLWMVLIFYFSNQPSASSTKMSDGVILTFAEAFCNGKSLSPNEKAEIIDKYVLITRKSAHFFVYFVLGILVFNLLIENKKIVKLILISTFICMLYAVSDEIHQYFVYGRSCEVRDIILDTTASLISSSICFCIYKSKVFKKRANSIR